MKIAMTGTRLLRREWVRFLQTLAVLLTAAGHTFRCTLRGDADAVFSQSAPASRVTRCLPFRNFGRERLRPGNRVEVAWSKSLLREAERYLDDDVPASGLLRHLAAANVLALRGADVLLVLPDPHRKGDSLDDHAMRVARAKGIPVIDLARGEGDLWSLRGRLGEVAQQMLLAEYCWWRRASGVWDREYWREAMRATLFCLWNHYLPQLGAEQLDTLSRLLPTSIVWASMGRFDHGLFGVRLPEDPIALRVYHRFPAGWAPTEVHGQPWSDWADVHKVEDRGDPNGDRLRHISRLGPAERTWWEATRLTGHRVLRQQVPGRRGDSYGKVMRDLAWGIFGRGFRQLQLKQKNLILRFRKAAKDADLDPQGAAAFADLVVETAKKRPQTSRARVLARACARLMKLAAALKPDPIKEPSSEPDLEFLVEMLKVRVPNADPVWLVWAENQARKLWAAWREEQPEDAASEPPETAAEPASTANLWWTTVGFRDPKDTSWDGAEEFDSFLAAMRKAKTPHALNLVHVPKGLPKRAARCLEALRAERMRRLKHRAARLAVAETALAT